MSTALKREPMRPAVGREEYVRYAPMVRRIAMRIARRVPRDVTVADLVAYGWVGLLEANARADGEMSEEEFVAYASHRVRGAMLDYLRSLDPMARRVRAQSRDIARAAADLSQQLGRAPEEEEVARKVSLNVDDYRVALQRIAEAGMAQLDVIDYDNIEALEERTDERVDRKLMIEAVAVAIHRLPERLQQVVALHHQEGCTLSQIGLILGVTEARVCQLHSEAMHRLRAAIGKT